MAAVGKQTSLVLPVPIWTKWRMQAAKEGRSMRDVFVSALDLYVAAQREAARRA